MSKFKRGDHVIGIFTVCKDTHEGKIHLIDGTVTSEFNNDLYTVRRTPQNDVIFVPEYNLLPHSDEMWKTLWERYDSYSYVVSHEERLIRDLFTQRR